jgi:membrane protein YdbS with pleckstrin-like domain
MSYNRWFYEFTPEGLKIEKGIIWKTYKNIPYQRIQNIEIHRGIIARMCGFSTVDLQTAGYAFSGHRGGRSRAEGHLPAIDIKAAEEIREFVMSKISTYTSGV